MNNLAPFRNGRLFDDLMAWQPPGSQLVWSAFPINVMHNDEGATVTVDLPGVDVADLDLTFESGTLMVTGKRGERTYRYSIALDDTIDPDGIEAKLDKGVLTVQAHKRAEAKPRKILITSTQNALQGDGSK